VQEKVAFEAFPSWKADYKRTNHAPSLDKWAERRPTVTSYLSKCENKVFQAVEKA